MNNHPLSIPRRLGWRQTATALAAAAAIALTALATTAHDAPADRGALTASASSSQCVPGMNMPTLTGGALSLPGSCTSPQGGSLPQWLYGQQNQQCQLTEAQQQELIARAQDGQAALDQAFQSALLKNLLAQAATKADGAVLSAQLSGHTGLGPQDVASLIQNGTVTPADMAAAVLQTLQELSESSGDTTVDTCAGIHTDTNNGITANSSDPPSAGGQSGQSQNVPADLGPDWVPEDPKNICQSTGCEDVAIEIQNKIGGTRYRIEDALGARYLGKYRGEDTYWNYHEVVINNGQVYDAWTGRTGEPLDAYLGDWQYAKWLKLTPIG